MSRNVEMGSAVLIGHTPQRTSHLSHWSGTDSDARESLSPGDGIAVTMYRILLSVEK
jgi:hypothetical protein